MLLLFLLLQFLLVLLHAQSKNYATARKESYLHGEMALTCSGGGGAALLLLLQPAAGSAPSPRLPRCSLRTPVVLALLQFATLPHSQQQRTKLEKTSCLRGSLALLLLLLLLLLWPKQQYHLPQQMSANLQGVLSTLTSAAAAYLAAAAASAFRCLHLLRASH